VDDTASTNEDTTLYIAPASLLANDTDVDSPPSALSVTAVASASHGTVSIVSGGAHDGQIEFIPAANYNGPASFEYTLSDGDLTATGLVNVTVNSVNDAPDGADNTITILEDGSHSFVASDFGFSDPTDDPADQLAGVVISSLPSAGSLELDGSAVAAGDEISLADLNAGKLSFSPDANDNGPAYASFTFQVRDDGGTANDGVDLDPEANTITVDVTSVNDAPVITAATVTPASINEAQAVALQVDFTDIEPGDAHSCAVTWGDGSAATTVNLAAGVTTCSAAHTYADDVPTATSSDANNVAVTITDDGTTAGVADHLSDSDGATVVVNNVAPTVSALFFTIDPVTGQSSASASWADPGADTESIRFEYFQGSVLIASRTWTDQARTGSIGDDGAPRFAPGCAERSLKITVTDDDTGSASKIFLWSSNDVSTARFQVTIKQNERIIAKYGNVVPIKVNVVSSCTGAAVTGLTLHITIANGDVDNVQPDATPEIVAESVSNADTGTLRRPNGNGYIYNFSTKQLKAGQDYTIRIRSLSISGAIIAKALFQPKK
jgi:hypothetical protein